MFRIFTVIQTCICIMFYDYCWVLGNGTYLLNQDGNLVPTNYVLCVLSCFSCVWLFVTLRTIACQAPLSVGFSRHEYWSGLPFPSPVPVVYLTKRFCLWVSEVVHSEGQERKGTGLGSFGWVLRLYLALELRGAPICMQSGWVIDIGVGEIHQSFCIMTSLCFQS